MAKAIRLPETPKEDTRDVQLTLTAKEAQTVFQILGKIDGWDGSGGERDNISNVYDALRNAGLKFSHTYSSIQGTMTVVK